MNYPAGGLSNVPILQQAGSQEVWLHGENQFDLATVYGFAVGSFGGALNSINLQPGSPYTAVPAQGSMPFLQPITDPSGRYLSPVNLPKLSQVAAFVLAGSMIYGQMLLEDNLGVPNATAYTVTGSSLRASDAQRGNRAEATALNGSPEPARPAPTEENAMLLQMASVTQHAISAASVIFAASRSLSPEERADQRKFYKKAYKKI